MKKKALSPIQFNNTKSLVDKNKKNLLKAITKVLNSGTFINGKENKKLEEDLSKLFPDGFITTLASGHDALYLALKSLNLKSTDEIIFPVNSYPTSFPVCLNIAKPIPVDVDINGQIDPQKIKENLSNNTKAIIVVHLYGLVGNLDEIIKICKNKKIFLIEDCAQAFGSEYRNKLIGTFGDISCFSFYPTKNLPTFGDGGAIYTKHKKFYDYFIKAKAYGEDKRYDSSFISFHSRLPEIQAAVLNCLIKKLKQNFTKKKKLINYYKSKLEKENLFNFVRILESHPNSDPVQHLLVLEAKNRDQLKKYLNKKGVPTMIHYPYSIHNVPAFSTFSFSKKNFPISDKLSNNIISLPFHQYLTKNEIDYIVKTIKDFYV